MKVNILKFLIFSIIILYCLLDKFTMILPFVLILSLMFIFDVKSLNRMSLKGNYYSNNVLWLMILGILSLNWAPNIDDSLLQIAKLLMLYVVSFLLFFYIKKFNFFSLIVYSVLFISFINHFSAIGITFFDFLMYNSSEIGGIDGVINGWGWGGRFSGILDNPNALAILMIFSLFLSTHTLNSEKYFSKNSFIRKICFLNIFLCINTIFTTQSRKGIIFGLLLVVLYFSLRLSYTRMIPYIVGILFILLLSSIFSDFLPNSSGAFERIESGLNFYSKENSMDNSARTRLYFISEGWKGFLESPILGYGINSFRYYYGFYSHNNFIEILYGFGILGFCVYYSMHVRLLRKLIINFKNNMYLIFFLFILLSMDFGFVSYESKLNMLVYITISLILIHKDGLGATSSKTV